MNNTLHVLFAVMMLVGLVSLVVAEESKEVTLSGTLLCAKCSLNKEDATKCQSVLVVEGDKAGEYYLVKNEVTETFGHVCKGSKAATVTGLVEEKDGKMWLTASKMETPKEG